MLDAQVKRMLADPKAFAMAENFAGQWLEIRNLDSIKPDPQKFPQWTPELRDAMKTETRMFFDTCCTRTGRSASSSTRATPSSTSSWRTTTASTA